MMNLFRQLLTLLLLVLCISPISAEEPTKLYPRLVAGTGWVRAGNDGIGTGWVVDVARRRMITNLHIVGERETVEVFFPDFDKRKSLITEREYYLQNQKPLHDRGRAVRGKVIERRPQSDLALIELNALPPDVRAIPLAKTEPGPGAVVCSVGHRHDSEGLWCLTVGEVRQNARWKEGYFWRGKRLAENAPIVLVQSPINNGDSGSALVNDRGEVVAVMSAIRWNTPGTAVGIAVSDVRALLGDAKKEEPKAPPLESLALRITRATVWVKPSATEGRAAGWIVDRERGLILTTSKAIGPSDRVDVVFPEWKEDRLIANVEAYRDRLKLFLDEKRRFTIIRGLVLARDQARDLALIEIGHIPPSSKELRPAKQVPKPGDKVCTINHPLGVDQLWLHSSGTVRQIAKVELTTDGIPNPPKFSTLLLQIPSHGGSPGSPIVNDAGEVVGLLATRESPQQQLGYALTIEEVRRFLESTRPLREPWNIVEFRERCRVLHDRGDDVTPLVEWDDYFELIGLPEKMDDDTFAALFDYAEFLATKPALDLLEMLEREYPKQPLPARGLLRRAECWALLNRKAEARKLCDTFLKSNPRWGEAWYVRSLTRDGKEALTDVNEAIEHEPKLQKAYLHRATLWDESNELEKAITDLSRAIELDPYSPIPVIRRLKSHLQIKDAKRAVADGERLIELLPLSEIAYHLAAETQLMKGDEARALEHFRSTLRLENAQLKVIIQEIVQHAEKLRVDWPDDLAKSDRWITSALKMMTSTITDQMTLKKLDKVMQTPDSQKRLELLRKWDQQ